jgi:hypothetical protein
MGNAGIRVREVEPAKKTFTGKRQFVRYCLARKVRARCITGHRRA